MTVICTMAPAVHPPPDTYTKIPFLQDSIGGVGGVVA